MKKLLQTIKTVIILLIFQFSIFNFQLINAQSVIRGPYLQSPGQQSMILRWRTDSATDSRVNYGTSMASLTTMVDSSNVTTEHRVKITGLTPHTTYYYSVGSTTTAFRGPDSLMHFTTAPDTMTSSPVRLWVIGDMGHNSQQQKDVRDSYVRYAHNNGAADLWVWCGDNAYPDGKDQEFQDKVFDSITSYKHLFLNLPFVPTSGNHDYNSICPWQSGVIPVLCNIDPNLHTGPYLDIIDPPIHGELGGVPSEKKLFYSMDYGDIHFIVLNSELGSYNNSYNWIGLQIIPGTARDTNFTSPMLEWLKLDLAATTKKWKIAIWHQCPYSGQQDLTEETSVQRFCVAMRHNFNPTLEKYGVDLVLTGHDHNYQRSFLINGHYGGKTDFTPAMKIDGSSGKEDLGEAYIKYTNGPQAGKGAVYVVSGNSSESNAYSPIVHPAIYYGDACDSCVGSVIIDINGDRLDGRYLTAKDSILDHFTIKKQLWPEGISEQKNVVDKFDVFPNPFHGQVTISYSLLKKSNAKLDVLDLKGRIVYSFFSKTLDAGKYNETLDFEKAGIAAGTYLIRLECEGGMKYEKTVKMN